MTTDTATTDFVLYEQTGRVVTLTLNRPAERNAIGSPDFCVALVEAVERANADAQVSCIIVTGAGSAFCAGGNVKTLAQKVGIGRGETPAASRALVAHARHFVA